MEIVSKICKTCLLDKNITEFGVRKISKDGYRNSCKECLYNQRKIWYNINKERVDEKAIEWRLNNIDRLKNNIETFHENNPNYRKEYYINNKSKINTRNKNRRENDNYFKIKENIRCLINNSFKHINSKKNCKTEQILGCPYKEFKQHIESKFENWMTWSNKGNPKDNVFELNKTWDIDHIIPISSAKTEEEIINLNHYSNLQPICSYVNRFIKKNKF